MNSDKTENLNGEIWEEIPGFYGQYFASNMGRVKSVYRKRLGKRFDKTASVNGTPDKNGYLRTIIRENGVKRYLSLHRLVAVTFIINPENKPDINHINGNKTDNRAENLEWVTKEENNNHAIKNNLFKCPLGQDHGCSKLRNEDVLFIRKNNKKYTQKQLGEMFGVTQSMISAIVINKNWRHLL